MESDMFLPNLRTMHSVWLLESRQNIKGGLLGKCFKLDE